MNYIYLIGVILIARLFYSFYKKDNTNQGLSEDNNANQELIKSNNANRKPTKRNKKLNKPEIASKNTWLYPTDEFGKMEKGTVYESKTYSHEINSSSKDEDFEVS